NIYSPDIVYKKFIQKFVHADYKQIFDGHEIDYDGFFKHIKKTTYNSLWCFIYLVEENYNIASFHRVYASIKPDNSKL
ncbi:nuclear transport factor 2 family protein, partial [Francisella tularensis subsp. holarctica]|nr:nuclear transport factor 2 family protein [Francisella tularensis subsp. holarctica]